MILVEILNTTWNLDVFASMFPHIFRVRNSHERMPPLCHPTDADKAVKIQVWGEGRRLLALSGGTGPCVCLQGTVLSCLSAILSKCRCANTDTLLILQLLTDFKQDKTGTLFSFFRPFSINSCVGLKTTSAHFFQTRPNCALVFPQCRAEWRWPDQCPHHGNRCWKQHTKNEGWKWK